MEDLGELERLHVDVEQVVAVPERVKSGSVSGVTSLAEYEALYGDSLQAQGELFWTARARQEVAWMRPFERALHGEFGEAADMAWFLGGQLNVCYNCVDRWVLQGRGDEVAIRREGNDPAHDPPRSITFAQLQRSVSQLANALLRRGVRKGDRVCIYMSMVIEAVVAMLACARIGAIHSVVFAGFSSDALADRILDADPAVVICCSEAVRGHKHIPLKQIVDEALLKCPNVRSVLVYRATSAAVPMRAGRDEDLLAAMAKERPVCPCVPVDSEDPLFMLYTSGSTGKPKGIVHTSGGYLTYAVTTAKMTFDLRPGDVYACLADVGWITGHSYIVYGILGAGASTFLFEGLPTFPDAGRYWQMVEKYKINVFYTAPTAIRTLMRYGNEFVTKYDRSSLRVLGSVGEPINPACWRWYYEVVGNSNTAIVDTYWQTETGGHVLTPLPCATPTKPGSCTLPFFGIEPVLLDPHTGQPLHGEARGVLCFKRPWPGIARTIWGDHERFVSTYFSQYKGYYFTGDGAYRDRDGYYWISGRVDDVINVSGHRLGTMEIESALVAHPSCSESAVVPVPHDIKGQAIVAFATLKEGYEDSDMLTLVNDLKFQIRHSISPIATPDHLFIVPALPKTRSGKIMRRILRKIAEGLSSQLGDVSTLADPSVVEQIIKIVSQAIPQNKHS